MSVESETILDWSLGDTGPLATEWQSGGGDGSSSGGTDSRRAGGSQQLIPSIFQLDLHLFTTCSWPILCWPGLWRLLLHYLLLQQLLVLLL